MDGSGQIPPKQVELTEAGEDFIKSAKIDIDEEPVEDRIEELRNRVDRLEDSLLHAYDRIEDLEGDEE
ncbi:hypothetical protein C492_19097 [Natronococcus jeotgali DSM 18795]|uniref:Uncharacterized protein n=2 Tax=Natronococcus jeotgali TaxID=413812 RepID=L9WTM0_9EURY|nr:hypothetical protein C492_19097 [Natronococcus jeotgali DSM 18795]